jgi:hypothetical protein
MGANKCGKATGMQGEVAKLRELLRMSGVKKTRIDRGVKRTNFKSNFSHPATVSGTRRNGKLEKGEVYAAAIKLLEKEEDRFVKSKGRSRRPFTDLVSSCTNFRVPWLFNDFNKATTSDDRSLLNIVRKIASIRRGIKNFKPNTYNYNLTFLHRLVRLMEKVVKRRSYVPYESSNLELLKGAPGDCTELTRFAHAVLRLAGFKPEFILVTKHAFSPQIRYHMAVGVPLDPKKPNKLTQVDLYHKGFLGYSHPEWVRATKRTMLAVEAVTSGFHWSALRNTVLKRTGLIARGMLYFVSTIMMLNYKRALQFDEYFPDAYYNMAGVLYKLGRRDAEVKKLNRKALELRPSMYDALYLARWLK